MGNANLAERLEGFAALLDLNGSGPGVPARAELIRSTPVDVAALQTGVALEVNGLLDRLDLAAGHVREALAAGVKIVCSTDPHSVRGLGNVALSVATARRGGARRADVLNTLPLSQLLSR